MRILLWHVHGSWTTAFVQGHHQYLVPVLPDRSSDGLGRARTWDWPGSVVEVPPEDLASADVDVVVLQRPHELRLADSWLGRRPGAAVPAVYVEHNAPEGSPYAARHPMADRHDLTVVHVTHFNRLMWDTGKTPTEVIEHGVVDPGHRFSGRLARAAVVVNEPLRRGRTTGTDLLVELARDLPVDVFGMGTAEVGGRNLVQDELHDELAERRVYLHLTRWTSLGLSLVEAMHLGLPVVALSTTETPEAVPPAAGVVTNRLDRLTEAVRWLLAEPAEARAMGAAARAHALERYGLGRFLADWDRLLHGVAA